MLLVIDEITLNGNVRLEEQHIEDLARSMNTIGQISPITVYMKDLTWHLVAGHRRLAAARSLGWTEIRAEEVDVDNGLAVQLAENIARDQLTPYEIAQGVLALKEETNLSQEHIANALGMSKKAVSIYQKIAKGTAGLDQLELNRLDERDLSMYSKLHDMPADIREDFIKDHEKEDFRHGFWQVPDYIAEVETWRWTQRKDNKALIEVLEASGAVPMSRNDRVGAQRLHGEEIDAHRGQPCHGWLVVKTWSNVNEGMELNEYCLDPRAHAKAVDPETGEADEKLQAVAKVAERHNVKGINQDKAREKARRANKLIRKGLVKDYADNPRVKPLMEAVIAVLLDIQRPYRWNQLGKAYGLTKASDQFHFDWDEYLSKYVPKEQLTQSLILAVGSVYIELESAYSTEKKDLLVKLDEIFGFNDENTDGLA